MNRRKETATGIKRGRLYRPAGFAVLCGRCGAVRCGAAFPAFSPVTVTISPGIEYPHELWEPLPCSHCAGTNRDCVDISHMPLVASFSFCSSSLCSFFLSLLSVSCPVSQPFCFCPSQISLVRFSTANVFSSFSLVFALNSCLKTLCISP